jgi:di/tricarboxylate transporter
MGPGGYKFSDYWRLGLPLEAVVVLVAVPLIMLFWT